ncbi:MAG: cytochrome c biogenesis protein CcsA [Cyclobacteriaceae bacterium]
MIHYLVGNLGHISVIVAFVASLVATYGYFKSVYADETAKHDWLKFARTAFYVHGVAVIGIVVCLFFIINKHFFEYHYAWSYSSATLPLHYQISTFWNGQEGSFLLWIFWHVVLGSVIINTNKFWEGPVMTIFALVQAFLVSMILGVVPGIELGEFAFSSDIRIGSSPFILLRESLDAPIFKTNPDFIPEDGTGLNPLLQNYWMVIHPPTLFLGFATTIIPFAYCLAGLWIGKYKEWVRPALPWALFSAMILGVGILMGAYWAYETLNFGGYWNWDPVENAVYVPWLVLIAAIHTMISFKKSETALKSSIILVIATFVMILYSTFLTRSGILGDSSVHSFTDLGLSGQLLIYLLAFLFLSAFLAIRVWKKLPSTDEEVSAYSREFWIFIGATTLSLMAFQIIIPTSIPVWNAIVELFGGISNIAPPIDQVEFYSKWQLWFAIILALLSGTGQFFWWKKIDRTKLKDAMMTPVILTLLIAGLVILISNWAQTGYFKAVGELLLLTAGLYSLVANATIFKSVIKTSPKLSGGAVAHIGIALMLLGILFSSGYSKIISLNRTGLVWSNEFPEEVNRDNLLIFQHEPRQMEEYELLYLGKRREVHGFPGFMNESDLRILPDPQFAVARKDIFYKEQLFFQEGDTVKLDGFENTYFEVKYTSNDDEFTLFPRIQMNESMGSVMSPDIDRRLTKDLYTHVRTFPDPEADIEWSPMDSVELRLGDTLYINDFVAVFEDVIRISELDGAPLDPTDVAVKAQINIQGSLDQQYLAEPIYLIRNQLVGRIPSEVDDVAAKITLLNIYPEQGTFEFGIETTQMNWIILEAVEKPLINVLWLGTFLVVVGFLIAINRRYTEFVKMRDKGVEAD